MADSAMVFNGIDAMTGSYLLPPLLPRTVSRIAQRQIADPSELKELRWWHQRASEAVFGPREGIDPRNLAETGWGVIFPYGFDPAVREALAELLDHRRDQACRVREQYYREFIGNGAYRPGESKHQFLARHGAGPGPADPEKVPYYLLIIGPPTDIPYSFQYQLDVQYAVGRIYFETIEEYAQYAHSVVAVETDGGISPRRATFFATTHPGDRATALSSSELIIPIAEEVRSGQAGWTVETHVGEEATKDRLAHILRGPNAPTLLFTATHGVGFPNGHPLQARRQGALLCQDWPGPSGGQQPISEESYLSAEDIEANARPLGLLSFHFACFGAGTPEWDEFAHNGAGARGQLAPYAFVAGLPKRLLGHPNGGAIALVGHVDRAWGYSFVWPDAGRQTAVYRSCLARLFGGHPIGSAFEYFNERYAELSSDLSAALEEVEFGKQPDDAELAAMWTANNDARGFAILGDPAVRLRGMTDPSEPSHQGVTEVMASDSDPGPAGVRAVRTDHHADKQDPILPPSAVVGARTSGQEPPDLGPSEGAELDFGFLEGVKGAQQRLITALQHLADNLGEAVQRAVDHLTVLEVATYVGDDLSVITYDSSNKRYGTGAELRILTRLSIDGNAQLLVPRELDEADEALWRLHAGLLEHAQSARGEFLKVGTSAVAGLLEALRVV